MWKHKQKNRWDDSWIQGIMKKWNDHLNKEKMIIDIGCSKIIYLKNEYLNNWYCKMKYSIIEIWKKWTFKSEDSYKCQC